MHDGLAASKMERSLKGMPLIVTHHDVALTNIPSSSDRERLRVGNEAISRAYNGWALGSDYIIVPSKFTFIKPL